MNQFGKQKIEINLNNPDIKQSKLIEDESYALTHGLSNARVNCDQTPKPCVQKTIQETCHESLILPDQSCTKTRHVTVGRDDINQRVDFQVTIAKYWHGIITVNLLTGAITHAIGGKTTPVPHLNHPCAVMNTVIHAMTINNVPAQLVTVIDSPSCQNNGRISLYIIQGAPQNYTINVQATLTMQSNPFEKEDYWNDGCTALDGPASLCQKKEEHCSAPTSTRVIDG